MTDILFYLFSTILLISALFVIFNSNAVNSAMAMIVTLISTAALFVLLESYFIATLQVLVYTGAVMVLFLFIIMLINVDKEKEYVFNSFNFSLVARFLGITILFILIINTFSFNFLPSPELNQLNALPEVINGFEFSTSAKSFGLVLFTKYMLPFQIIGVLLLIAMIGVIIISKKQDL